MWDQARGISRVYSSAVEHGIADPAVAGSIPAAPFTFALHFFIFFKGGGAGPGARARPAVDARIAPPMSLWPNWTRRLTTNQKIGGSSPSRDMILFCIAPLRGSSQAQLQVGDCAHRVGALAQSVECVLCKHEVQGSKP